MFVQKGMQNFKREGGITLIALIITIIILVILAAVSINAAYNSGIVNYAVNGTQNYIKAAKKEEEYVQNANNLMQSVMNRIDGLPVTAYTQPYFPSEDFKRVAGTYLANGLVIEDTTNGNQFVWIEVPNNGSGPNYSDVPAANDAAYYTKIEEALQSYASTYRSANFQDAWYDGCGLPQTGDGSYENTYHRMLSSVYTHGGFWIGRYETGIAYDDENGFRSAASENTPQNPVIKKDAYPYNFVTVSQAQTLASSINSGGCTSSLMFGIQWDLVMKYLETKVNWDTSGGYTAVNYLKRGDGWTTSNHGPGSTSWGNYKDAEFTITSENAKRRVENGDLWDWIGSEDEGYSNTKAENSNVLLTTGANEERNSKMNICDLAGNVWELTLQKKITGSVPCTSRGCDCDTESSWSISAWGHWAFETSKKDRFLGFRVTLY